MKPNQENSKNGLEVQELPPSVDLFGWETLIGGLEGMISEAWHAAENTCLPGQRNLFGREVVFSRP